MHSRNDDTGPSYVQPNEAKHPGHIVHHHLLLFGAQLEQEIPWSGRDARTSCPTVRHHVQFDWCGNASRSREVGAVCLASVLGPGPNHHLHGGKGPRRMRHRSISLVLTVMLSHGVSRAEEPATDSTLSMSDMLSSTSVWAWILALTDILTTPRHW